MSWDVSLLRVSRTSQFTLALSPVISGATQLRNANPFSLVSLRLSIIFSLVSRTWRTAFTFSSRRWPLPRRNGQNGSDGRCIAILRSGTWVSESRVGRDSCWLQLRLTGGCRSRCNACARRNQHPVSSSGTTTTSFLPEKDKMPNSSPECG